MSYIEIYLTSPVNYHLVILATSLISTVSAADFQVRKKKLVNEVRFSLYYRDGTGTKFCYCPHFLYQRPMERVEINLAST